MHTHDVVCDMSNPLAAAYLLGLLAASETDASVKASLVADALDRLPDATSREAALDPDRWGRAIAVLLSSLTRDQRVRVLAPIQANQAGLTQIRHILPALPLPCTGPGVDQSYFAMISTITRVVCDRPADSEYQHQEIVRDLLDLLPLIQPIGRRTPVLDRAYSLAAMLDECDLRDEFLVRIAFGFADFSYGMSAYNVLCQVSDTTTKAHAMCRLALHPAAASDQLGLKQTLDGALHNAALIDDAHDRLWALIAVFEACAADASDPKRRSQALALATGEQRV